MVESDIVFNLLIDMILNKGRVFL